MRVAPPQPLCRAAAAWLRDQRSRLYGLNRALLGGCGRHWRLFAAAGLQCLVVGQHVGQHGGPRQRHAHPETPVAMQRLLARMRMVLMLVVVVLMLGHANGQCKEGERALTLGERKIPYFSVGGRDLLRVATISRTASGCVGSLHTAVQPVACLVSSPQDVQVNTAILAGLGKRQILVPDEYLFLGRQPT